MVAYSPPPGGGASVAKPLSSLWKVTHSGKAGEFLAFGCSGRCTGSSIYHH